MSLTERDELDLAGLASGWGKPDSDARAQQLIQADSEAAEFSREIASICQALESHAEASVTPLSPSETDVLAATILAKAQRARAARRWPIRHPWRWTGIAAAIMLAAGTWFSANRYAYPVVAEAIITPPAGALNIPATCRIERRTIRAGQAIETQSERIVLNLANGGQVIVAEGTCVAFQRTGRTIELKKGNLFVQAATPIQVQAGDATIDVEGNPSLAEIWTSPDKSTCTVYSGSSKLVRHDHEVRLSERNKATWQETEDAQVSPCTVEAPPWVRQALGLPGKR